MAGGSDMDYSPCSIRATLCLWDFIHSILFPLLMGLSVLWYPCSSAKHILSSVPLHRLCPWPRTLTPNPWIACFLHLWRLIILLSPNPKHPFFFTIILYPHVVLNFAFNTYYSLNYISFVYFLALLTRM